MVMKPRLSSRRPLLLNHAFTGPKRSVAQSHRRYVASSSSSPSPISRPSPSRSGQRQWLRLAVVTITATGIGAYIRWQQESGFGSSNTLNPLRFTPYYLVSREPVSSTGSIFTLKPPVSDESNREIYEEAWKAGVWSVMFKQPQLQIGRDYTPLPPTSADGEDEECLRFFIRKEPFGEVSRYLHSLKVGAAIEVRGPRVECEIPSDTNQILFIAGGTGIAPALQAGHTLLRRTNESHKPRIHILWANRTREDCKGAQTRAANSASDQSRMSWLFRGFKSSNSTVQPAPEVDVSKEQNTSLVVRELEALQSQYPGQVTVDYFIDEDNSFVGKKTILDYIESVKPSPATFKRNMILVSGPDGFISYMAGPKLWAEGMELQGPLRGIIKELKLQDWVVWKL